MSEGVGDSRVCARMGAGGRMPGWCNGDDTRSGFEGTFASRGMRPLSGKTGLSEGIRNFTSQCTKRVCQENTIKNLHLVIQMRAVKRKYKWVKL